MLYDSDIDGKEGKIVNNKIMNHNQLYFIVIDSNDNVFVHYHFGVIDQHGYNYDSNMFIFTLNNNGRCKIKKCETNKTCKKYGHTFGVIVNIMNVVMMVSIILMMSVIISI